VPLPANLRISEAGQIRVLFASVRHPWGTGNAIFLDPVTEPRDPLAIRLHTLMRASSVIPFLGAGTGRAGRTSGEAWLRGKNLPDSTELARYLAKEYGYPRGDDPDPDLQFELVRVAQFVDDMVGEVALLQELRTAFAGPSQPNLVHRYLAQQPGRAREAGQPNPWPLIVTANYDDLLEIAFEEAGERYDVVTYFARGRDRKPAFLHHSGRGEAGQIAGPRYDKFALGERTVIVKMHGSIDRIDERADSFVITENDYIRYMSKRAADRLPSCLVNALIECHFLFLGYRLADWNLRAFLFSIWEAHLDTANSWAIQKGSEELERRYWLNHDVEIVERPLETWVEQMLAAEAHGDTE
jgi:SIR2-like domain